MSKNRQEGRHAHRNRKPQHEKEMAYELGRCQTEKEQTLVQRTFPPLFSLLGTLRLSSVPTALVQRTSPHYLSWLETMRLSSAPTALVQRPHCACPAHISPLPLLETLRLSSVPIALVQRPHCAHISPILLLETMRMSSPRTALAQRPTALVQRIAPLYLFWKPCACSAQIVGKNTLRPPRVSSKGFQKTGGKLSQVVAPMLVVAKALQATALLIKDRQATPQFS